MYDDFDEIGISVNIWLAVITQNITINQSYTYDAANAASHI